MIYETIYKKLYRVIPDLDRIKEHAKSHSEPFMDLSLDILERGNGYTIIAIAHNYEQNGDLVPDPDMTIKVHHDLKMAEALTYQDSFRYQEVYPEPGLVYPKMKKELNSFLNQWLTNLRKQGHKIEVEKEAAL